MTSNITLKLITFDLEGGSVNRCFKTPVIIANTGCRKRLSRKLGCGKIAALFLNIPTRGHTLIRLRARPILRAPFGTWTKAFPSGDNYAVNGIATSIMENL